MQLLSAHCSSQLYLINLHFEGCLGSFNFKKDQGCGLLVYSDKGDLLIIISRSKWSSKTYMKLKVALVVSLKNFLTWEKQGLEPGLCYYLFIYLWLCWIFIAVRRLSLVVVRGLLICDGFSCRRAKALGRVGFSLCSTRAQ